jgi:hypothetical protein
MYPAPPVTSSFTRVPPTLRQFLSPHDTERT